MKIQGPFSLLASVKKGSDAEAIAQRVTVHRWGGCASGLTHQMEGTKTLRTSESCDSRQVSLTTAINLVLYWMLLHSLHTLKLEMSGSPIAKCIDGKWRYRAVALNTETGVEVVEEGIGSAQVGELKAVLLAVKEKTKPICVNSYVLWAGATVVVSVGSAGLASEGKRDLAEGRLEVVVVTGPIPWTNAHRMGQSSCK